MILTEHHFELPILKGDCTGSSESYTCQNATFIVWKAHVAAQITNPHGIQ